MTMFTDNTLSGIWGAAIQALAAISTIAVSVWALLVARRAEGKVKMVEWISDMAQAFRESADHVNVRLLLARDRDKVRQQLLLETLYDDLDVAALRGKDVLTSMDADWLASLNLRDSEEIHKKLDWEMLRRFTDYLYFFERLLMQGEALSRQRLHGDALMLIDHFGWFMRSLVCYWIGPDARNHADPHDGWRARAFFVLYLGSNRYRRLAQVALLFVKEVAREEINRAPAKGAQIRGLMDELLANLLAEQTRHGHADWRTEEDLRRKWSRMLTSVGISKH